MAEERPHLFLSGWQEVQNFKTPRRVQADSSSPQRDRQSHSRKLQDQWAAIWASAEEQVGSRTAAAVAVRNGVYVEFEGAPGFDLVTKSLEDRRAGIRLLNICTVSSANEPTLEVTKATVFIPLGKQDQFLKKIKQYANEITKNGNPKQALLIQSVENIRLAVLESFWRDDPGLMPQSVPMWCEIWLQGTGEEVEGRFRLVASELGIEVQLQALEFPERTVLLGKASREQLSSLVEASPHIAEFRRAKEAARFFLEMENQGQTEWVRDLDARLKVDSEAKVSVCILDTGANNGHFLLKPVLADSDCHAVDPSWGVNDHNGHGTLMCGIAAFGDLTIALQHRDELRVEHCLESAKILPPKGENDPFLYGEITIQAIYRSSIQAPDRKRIGCMAVTSTDGRDQGRPSSWSAAIDKFISGYDDGVKRLFVVAAGNVEQSIWALYPKSNLLCPVHDPGQSWNALTIGAFTEKAILSDQNLKDHKPLAQPGELSPFSSTSLTWEDKWPIKPDVVIEGGNLAKGPDNLISEYDDLSLLSTGHQPTKRQFGAINATSAATAQAAWMTAQIQTRYPDAWPETIRGLMIHSADWPIAMKRQFLSESGRGEFSKTDYGRLLRICGYGVPNLEKALTCKGNSLTLISEAEIQPYTKKVDGSGYSTKDMHTHRLPWPREVLLELGETPVELRVTLSYFIEPGPGEVGWRDKYRYASHGLRFDLNNTSETEELFLRRLNAAVREDGERSESQSGSERWLLGVNNRNTGSVHSDIWKGTAADIASCNMIGVYPVIGWWRERAWLGRWSSMARYSLIVSLRTPDESVDIYTPVAIQLGIPVEVAV